MPNPVLPAEGVCPNRPGRGHEWYSRGSERFCRDCGYGVTPGYDHKHTLDCTCYAQPPGVIGMLASMQQAMEPKLIYVYERDWLALKAEVERLQRELMEALRPEHSDGPGGSDA